MCKRMFLPLILVVVALAATQLPAKLKTSDWNKVRREVQQLLAQGKDAPAERLEKALRRLAEDNSERAVKALIEIAMGQNITDSVYTAIKDALASITDPKAMKLIMKELEKRTGKNYETKVMLIEVAARIPGPDKVSIISDVCATERNQWVIFACIRAFRAIGNKEVVQPLIDLVKRYQTVKGRVWMDARQALFDITGQDFEDPRDWENWWGQAKTTWTGPDEQQKKKKETSVDRESEGYTTAVPKETPKFFGTEVVSKFVVFVLDTSGSMKIRDPGESGEEKKSDNQPKTGLADPDKKKDKGKKGAGGGNANLPEERMRIRRAKKELINCIKKLKPDVKFNIVTYDSRIKVWSDSGLKLATAANKKSAIKFAENFQANGTTHMDEALFKAFEDNIDADTIYLLSDGWPTHKGDNSDAKEIEKRIFEYMDKNNKFRKVRIFTFGFRDAHRSFMVELARKHGGKYHDIK